MNRNKKQNYPGQYLDMWANVLQGKEQEMPVKGTGISDIIHAIEELEKRVRYLEQRLQGQDERIFDAVQEMANKTILVKKELTEDINKLRLNTVSYNLFLDLKKQVEELKERLGE